MTTGTGERSGTLHGQSRPTPVDLEDGGGWLRGAEPFSD